MWPKNCPTIVLSYLIWSLCDVGVVHVQCKCNMSEANTSRTHMHMDAHRKIGTLAHRIMNTGTSSHMKGSLIHAASVYRSTQSASM